MTPVTSSATAAVAGGPPPEEPPPAYEELFPVAEQQSRNWPEEQPQRVSPSTGLQVRLEPAENEGRGGGGSEDPGLRSQTA